MLRASGALDAFADLLAPLIERIGVPAETVPLEAKVEACKKFLEAKKVEADELAKKISAIPLKDMLGPEAKNLKEQASKIGESVKKVTAQMDAYAKELKSKAAAK